MSRFKFEDTPIMGLKIISRTPLIDQRGSFTRIYCDQDFLGVFDSPICQVNHSITEKKGAIRGLHYQMYPNAEKKIVTCIVGAIFDVAVDLRRDSPTFLKWYGRELSDKNCKSMLLPEGVAHGFQALSDRVEMIYFHTKPYSSGSEGGVNPFDENISIEWPYECTEISSRDSSLPYLTSNFEVKFL